MSAGRSRTPSAIPGLMPHEATTWNKRHSPLSGTRTGTRTFGPLFPMYEDRIILCRRSFARFSSHRQNVVVSTPAIRCSPHRQALPSGNPGPQAEPITSALGACAAAVPSLVDLSHWEVPGTCGIRPDPTSVRPCPLLKVWTLSTRPNRPSRALQIRTAPPVVLRSAPFASYPDAVETRLLDQVVGTDYGQFDLVWTQDGGFDGDFDRVFAGQVNGLVGAAYLTGLKSTLARRSAGSPVRIVLMDGPAMNDPSWEDVVEVSFVLPEGHEMQWSTWAGANRGTGRSSTGHLPVAGQRHGKRPGTRDVRRPPG